MQPSPPPVPNWSRFRTIRQVLDELCVVYGFEAALLVGDEGLPLAAGVPAGAETPAPDPEVLAAIAGDLKMAARRAQTQLGWGQFDEVNMMVRAGARLVGRPIALQNQDLMLVVLLPYWMSYHRAVTQAVEVIRWAWTERGLKLGTQEQS